MTNRQQVYEAVSRERDYQQRKWGERNHTVGNWLLIMEGELAEAKRAWIKGVGDKDALLELLQVVAVGVACLESHGVVERRDTDASQVETTGHP